MDCHAMFGLIPAPLSMALDMCFNFDIETQRNQGPDDEVTVSASFLLGRVPSLFTMGRLTTRIEFVEP